MKNKLLILNIAGFLFIVCIFIFGYFSFADNTKSLKDFNQKVLEGSKKKEQISNLQADFQKSKEDIDLVNSVLVPKGAEVSVIEYIENVAKGVGLEVEINSVNIEKIDILTANNLSNLVLNIKTKGSWKEVFNFLGLLEAMPYKSEINKISLVYSNDDKNKPISLWEGIFVVKILKKNE